MFEPDIVMQIKNKIKNHLRTGFVGVARYVDWITNVVPVHKKNE